MPIGTHYSVSVSTYFYCCIFHETWGLLGHDLGTAGKRNASLTCSLNIVKLKCERTKFIARGRYPSSFPHVLRVSKVDFGKLFCNNKHVGLFFFSQMLFILCIHVWSLTDFTRGQMAHVSEARLSNPVFSLVRKLFCVDSGTNIDNIDRGGGLVDVSINIQMFTKTEQNTKTIWSMNRWL